MSSSLRQIKERIRSVENTWKIARAMEMISVSKLRRLEQGLAAQRAYGVGLGRVVAGLSSYPAPKAHPLCLCGPKEGRVAVCLVTSDTGLCGAYNDHVIRRASEFLAERRSQEVRLVALGKKGFVYFKSRNVPVDRSFLGWHGRIQESFFSEAVSFLTSSFLKKEFAEVYLACTRYDSATRHRPVVERLLPMAGLDAAVGPKVCEPDAATVLDEVLPVFLFSQVRLALLESFACEHSARALAMRSANDNAKELLEHLVLTRNKIRQASITKDVIEIISSAEALKG